MVRDARQYWGLVHVENNDLLLGVHINANNIEITILRFWSAQAKANFSTKGRRMKSFERIALAIMCFVISTVCFAQPIKLKTPRGAQLEVIAEFPAGDGPFPVLVLAPGQGYHMGLPAMEATAKEMVAQRIAVYRFNWAYFSSDAKSGQPSKEYVAEIEDMTTVLNKARSDPRVAKDKIAVAGKSLGSVVAWQVLAKHKDIKGGLFLTPVCSETQSGHVISSTVAAGNYPGIGNEKRPLAFIAGEADPLCAAPALYQYVSQAGGPTRISIVGGNHGFANPKLTGTLGDEAMKSNVKIVALLAADFVSELMR
jgi:dienelactone hydrolase